MGQTTISGNYDLENSQKLSKVTKFSKKKSPINLENDLIPLFSPRLLIEFELCIQKTISGIYDVGNSQKQPKITEFIKEKSPAGIEINLIPLARFKLR